MLMKYLLTYEGYNYGNLATNDNPRDYQTNVGDASGGAVLDDPKPKDYKMKNFKLNLKKKSNKDNIKKSKIEKIIGFNTNDDIADYLPVRKPGTEGTSTPPIY